MELVVEVTAKRRLGHVFSNADIHTNNDIVWAAARHRAECQPYMGKTLVNSWRLALRKNKDGTTKNEEEKKQKNEKTEVQKKWRNQRNTGKVQQVIDGGSVQVGACERPGRCQPSRLRKKIEVSLCIRRLR